MSELSLNFLPAISVACPYFTKCGGCDFLNLEEEDYRQLKQKSLGLDSFYLVLKPEWISIGPKSRRKITLQIGSKNEVGFFSAKSNIIVEIEKCFVAEEKISDLILPLKNFLKSQQQHFFIQIAITLFDNGLDLVFDVKKEPAFVQMQKLLNFARENDFNLSYRLKNHITPIFLARKNQIFYPDFKINLDSEIFIQATKSGLAKIIETIRNFLAANKNIRNVADIYAGFGAYSFAIQDLVKTILAVEGSKKMVDLIIKNAAANDLSNKIRAKICDLFLTPLTQKSLNQLDLVIINPPRNSKSAQIIEIAKSTLQNVIYISCNPKSFKRDCKILIDSGFRVTKIAILDQFYATRHVEIISILQK
jgi:23S rRNA (uracil1939-C5)-methyltransferase